MVNDHLRTIGRFSLYMSFMVLLFTSCKKRIVDDQDGSNPPGGTAATQLSDADSLKYLMYRVMEKTFVDDGRDLTTNFPLYFWYDKVPDIDPLSSEFPTAQDLLNKMMSYTIGSEGTPLDRYTFLDDGSVVSELQGTGGDMGLDVGLINEGTANNPLIYGVVLSVAKNSPAEQAGVQRGWVIQTINNQSGQMSSNGDIDRLSDAVFNDDQATFGFQKPDNSTANVTLMKAEYVIDPILFDTVYNVGGKKIGYFVFSTFTDVFDDSDETQPSATQTELNNLFADFASKNISGLIVDLRYNGGGAVTTAEFLCNQIAPAAANGKLMYEQRYNALLQPELQREGIPLKTNFNTIGRLNLPDGVFFIGGGNTASASELVINNLKPYMPVKLVGDTTYGKPVGSISWPITITKNGQEQLLSYLFPIAFDMHNANGVGDYYDGLAPDEEAVDYVDLPWGSVNDDNLNKIFGFIKNGSFARTPSPSLRSNRFLTKVPGLKKIRSLRFNGMVDPSVRLRSVR